MLISAAMSCAEALSLRALELREVNGHLSDVPHADFTAPAIGNRLSPLSFIESLEIDSMQSGSKMKLSIQVSTVQV